MDRDDAERSQRMVEEQIIRALANRKRTDEEDTPVFSELMRSDEEEKSKKLFGMTHFYSDTFSTVNSYIQLVWPN